MDAMIFDWGGTLTPWHTVDLTEQWRVYASAYHSGSADAIAAALRDAEAEAWRIAREEHRSTTLEVLISSVGLDPSGPAHVRALQAYRDFWEPHTFSDEEVMPLFSAIRERGVAIGVLSNTVWSRAEHEAIFRRDGVLGLIDGAVYTSEIEWTKPHSEAFVLAMKAVGAADPRRCVYVGDRLFDDIYGARSAGMRAVLLPHSAIPEDQRGPLDGEPDAVVNRLFDLLPLVDQWAR